MPLDSVLGIERVLDVVRPRVDDVAVIDDREAGHERAAGHAVAAHVVHAIRTVGLQVLVLGTVDPGIRELGAGLRVWLPRFSPSSWLP